MRSLLLIVATLCVGASHALAQRLDRLREAVPFDAFQSNELVAADIDGDGFVDLVGLCPNGGTIARLNDGAGSFAGTELRITDTALLNILVADVDGDGLADVIGRSAGYLLYRQGPPGTFTEDPAALPLGLNGSMRCFDLENDGDLDLIQFLSTSPRFLRNDGSGTFEDITSTLPTTGFVRRAVVLDADGDGDDDLLVDAPVRLLRTDGLGSFTVENQPLHNINGNTYRAVDLEGDGDLDMVLDNGLWAENDGTGSFSGGNVLPSPSGGVFVDFDSDGRMDLVRPASFGEGLEALRGVEPTQLVPFPNAVLDRFEGQEIERLIAGDFDDDGDADLFVETDRFDILWGDGEGNWELALSSPERLDEVYEGLQASDYDGDGILDGLGIVVDDLGERFVWIRGAGAGAFEAPRDVSLVGEWTAAGAIDLENDGDTDALLVSETEARAFRFDPSSLWIASTNAVSVAGGVGGPNVADVLVGDLNADGFEDAIVLCTRLGGVQTPDYVLLNDGSGELLDANAGLGNAYFRGDLGDLDRDGDLDFVALRSGQASVFLNRGDGSFDFGTQNLSLLTNRASLRLVDLDGSGALDLALVVNSPSRAVEIHAGNGDGTFATTPAATLPRQGSALLPTWLGIPDVDGDGLAELYLPDARTGTFYANRGGFVFEDLSMGSPTIAVNSRGVRMAVADFDADGDDDVWLSGETQILWSLQRQLSWATWPRYGKPLRMELAGSPNCFWGLYASPATASIPSPLGLFLLDPAQGVALGSGLLDGNGDASANFAVPAEVSLVSPVLYWQGLAGTPLRFTNLETTAFSVF